MPGLHSWYESKKLQSKRPRLKQIKREVSISKRYKCKRLANTIYTPTYSPGVVTCAGPWKCKEQEHSMAGAIAPGNSFLLLEHSFPFCPGLLSVSDGEESPPARPTHLNLKIYIDAYMINQQP